MLLYTNPNGLPAVLRYAATNPGRTAAMADLNDSRGAAWEWWDRSDAGY